MAATYTHDIYGNLTQILGHRRVHDGGRLTTWP